MVAAEYLIGALATLEGDNRIEPQACSWLAGFRVDYDGRSVVISGDTKFSENLIKFASGVDVLIHQVAMAKDELMQSSPPVRTILDHHTKPDEAGVTFTRAKPKLAVFYHIVLQGAPQFPRRPKRMSWPRPGQPMPARLRSAKT